MSETLYDLKVIILKEFRQQLRKPFVILLPVFCLVPMMIGSVLQIRRLTGLGLGSMVQVVVDNLSINSSVSFFLIACFVIITSIFYKEKQNRAIESLLTTPLTPLKIWLGKSLFLFIWGYTFSILGLALNILTIAYFGDTVEHMILPGSASLIFLTLLFPFLTFLMACLVGLINLTSSSGIIGNMLVLLLGIGLNFYSSMNMDKASDPTFRLMYYSIIVVLLAFVVLLLLRRLNREQIVCSE